MIVCKGFSSQCLKKLLIVRDFWLFTFGCTMWYPVVRQTRVRKNREFTWESTVRKHHTKFDLCDSIQYLFVCKNSRLNLTFWWPCWNCNRGQKLPSKHDRLGPRVFARFLIFLSAWVARAHSLSFLLGCIIIFIHLSHTCFFSWEMNPLESGRVWFWSTHTQWVLQSFVRIGLWSCSTIYRILFNRYRKVTLPIQNIFKSIQKLIEHFVVFIEQDSVDYSTRSLTNSCITLYYSLCTSKIIRVRTLMGSFLRRSNHAKVMILIKIMIL